MTKAKPKAKAAPATAPERKDYASTQAVQVLSRCPRCGSTERSPYTNPTEIAHGGTNSDGSIYTHVVYRSTVCRACGQCRRDRCTENRIDTSPPAQ